MRNNDGSLSLFGFGFGGSAVGVVVITALALLGYLLNTAARAQSEAVDPVPPIYCDTAAQVRQVVEARNKAPDALQFMAWVRAVNTVNILTLSQPVCSIESAHFQQGGSIGLVMIGHMAYEIRQVEVIAVMGVDYAWRPVHRMMYTLIAVRGYGI